MMGFEIPTHLGWVLVSDRQATTILSEGAFVGTSGMAARAGQRCHGNYAPNGVGFEMKRSDEAAVFELSSLRWLPSLPNVR